MFLATITTRRSTHYGPSPSSPIAGPGRSRRRAAGSRPEGRWRRDSSSSSPVPDLVGRAGARPQHDGGTVRGGVAADVQAQARGRVADGGAGGERPPLIGSAGAVPQLRL